jgi:hypothetical protein
MAKLYNDKKFQLGEPVATMLRDFLAANYNAPALELIREAVKEHIEARLENPEIRARYDRARKKRLGISEAVVSLTDVKNKNASD